MIYIESFLKRVEQYRIKKKYLCGEAVFLEKRNLFAVMRCNVEVNNIMDRDTIIGVVFFRICLYER